MCIDKYRQHPCINIIVGYLLFLCTQFLFLFIFIDCLPYIQHNKQECSGSSLHHITSYTQLGVHHVSLFTPMKSWDVEKRFPGKHFDYISLQGSNGSQCSAKKSLFILKLHMTIT